MTLGGRYYTPEELAGFGFKRLGTNIKIHNRASIYFPENISIGDNVRIDDFSIIIATGNLTIGSYVSIPNFCFIGSKYGIVLNDFVTLAPGVQIFSASDDYHGNRLTNPTVGAQFSGGKCGRVELGRHVIIGAQTVILPKVVVEEGCAIGALSLVKTDLEAWGIYAGIPVRRVGNRRKGLLQLEYQLKETA